MAKKKQDRDFKSVLLAIAIRLVAIVLVIIVLFLGSVYVGMWGALPNRQTLENISNSQSTIVYDSQHEIIGKFYLFDRTSVDFDDLPDHLVQALVATEDARFYDHGGVDYRSMLRVLIKTLIMGNRSAGGGSTISQQLAKNLFPRENLSKLGLAIAKIKEGITATRLEKIYSKEEIVTLYLNTVSFPDNAFGIETASRKFYNKKVNDLTLEESASLIGSLKATYTYNPRLHPEASLKRRNVVLSQMVKYDYLEESEYDQIKEHITELNYDKGHTSEDTAPYFLEQVRLLAKQMLASANKEDESQYNLYTDGLKIYTTLDLRMQRKAEAALKQHMPSIQKSFENNWGNQAPWLKDKAFIQALILESNAYKELINNGMSKEEAINKLNEKRSMSWFDWKDSEDLVQASTKDSLLHYAKLLSAGFLAMDPKTGAIKSWIGGIDHEHYKYDHINQSKRQVGSTFKPFVYAAALERGVAPCDHISGKTITYTNFDNWTPSNSTTEYDDKYISMQAALTQSINTIAVKLMEKAGVGNVIDLAKNAGIKSSLPKVPSLALGTAELSVIELAQAYSIFLNNGYSTEPYMIESIVDADGMVVYERETPEQLLKVISEYTYEVMQQLLQAVTQSGGTGSRLRWKYNLTQDIAGKTGTTQSNRDGWFVGMSPDLLTVSWVGCDDSRLHFKDTQYGQGANSALPLFGLFYQKMVADSDFNKLTRAQFDEPSDEVQEDLDCEGIKEEGFFKGLFNQEDKPKEELFDKKNEEELEGEDEQEEDNTGVFKKLKKMFKKNN
ncbi:transglycosylase domain-containing protein [Reichenbachiella agarivorans]|uniref:Transglycosylase domain-containing protein n=1 Tax=Reichenbachiella agarivorans TaxID=2979464 RepID=A0ABY6CM06_9BACT|nr:transglycosylase domain-containing protein [Reichenbachiella agarivorans]UXP31541.1 transglycosylase domain-containing protein [Reichenbachiella agarivorans]